MGKISPHDGDTVQGERWFHHTLVDADQAINPMMWQNAGKSGLDQWNFTMNVASAGKTQDPKGLSVVVGFGKKNIGKINVFISMCLFFLS